MKYSQLINTPIGWLEIIESQRLISQINFVDERFHSQEIPIETGLLKIAKEQLNAYFSGTLREFDLPLDIRGTSFQKAVYQELLNIPYGEVISYRTLAQRVGSPKASRAVGNANHHNPLPIIIPCHRVILNDGKIGGYGGGISMKSWLLNLEQDT